MSNRIPERPQDYLPPARPRLRTPEQYARFGRFVIGFGFVFCVAGFAYFMRGGAMTATQALLSVIPLFLIFAALGWSYCRLGADGPGVIASYLSATAGACALLAFWLWGK